MASPPNRIRAVGASLHLAARALRTWTPRQMAAAGISALAVGLVIGIATVLIPNPVFTRDIAPVPWNYPVWIATSVLSGILIATYVQPSPSPSPGGDDGSDGTMQARSAGAPDSEPDPGPGRRSARLGGAAGILAWFAVGCPVCNKIALIALGYTGALAWFAPLQPFLAVTAIALCLVAVVRRLQGQMVCAMPRSRVRDDSSEMIAS